MLWQSKTAVQVKVLKGLAQAIFLYAWERPRIMFLDKWKLLFSCCVLEELQTRAVLAGQAPVHVIRPRPHPPNAPPAQALHQGYAYCSQYGVSRLLCGNAEIRTIRDPAAY